MVPPVSAAVQSLAAALTRQRVRIVFAESCTAGLVSAQLARVPGISEWHCGSAVVYRLGTKHQWLGISEAMLNDPGPVSREVACAMAQGVLERTPEADFSASITGHLGPNAPAEQDGLVWMASARRSDHGVQIVAAESHRLPGDSAEGLSVRETRQSVAAALLLEFARQAIERASPR